jgi:hypothetical protein
MPKTGRIDETEHRSQVRVNRALAPRSPGFAWRAGAAAKPSRTTLDSSGLDAATGRLERPRLLPVRIEQPCESN